MQKKSFKFPICLKPGVINFGNCWKGRTCKMCGWINIFLLKTFTGEKRGKNCFSLTEWLTQYFLLFLDFKVCQWNVVQFADGSAERAELQLHDGWVTRQVWHEAWKWILDWPDWSSAEKRDWYKCHGSHCHVWEGSGKFQNIVEKRMNNLTREGPAAQNCVTPTLQHLQ